MASPNFSRGPKALELLELTILLLEAGGRLTSKTRWPWGKPAWILYVYPGLIGDSFFHPKGDF